LIEKKISDAEKLAAIFSDKLPLEKTIPSPHYPLHRPFTDFNVFLRHLQAAVSC
jgi:hypothetical protein